MLKFSATVLMVIIFAATSSHAGWFDDAVQGATERLGNRAVDDAAEGAYEGAKDGIRKGTGTDDGEVNNKKKIKSNKSVDKAYAPESGPDLAAAEGVFSKYDFIPGDKVLFFDDFSDTDEGEFPRKWTLKGPGSGGNNSAVEVVRNQGRKLLRIQPSKEDQYYALQYIRLNQKGDLPQKFTLEFDAVFGSAVENSDILNEYFVMLWSDGLSEIPGTVATVGSLRFSGAIGESANTRSAIRKEDNKAHHVAISVNGTFVKAYVDNERVVNDPDAVVRPIKHVGIWMGTPHNSESTTVMFTNFRLAEGGKNIKSALDTDGKIVTHGILFDTGSDRIKPESLPTLKMILALLEGDPSLKFSIEGHTDNQGGKNINQPLSEKRGAAVKTWLAGKGIAADRLKSKGWGDTKPIDTANTVEGRANNRRVEFIKI